MDFQEVLFEAKANCIPSLNEGSSAIFAKSLRPNMRPRAKGAMHIVAMPFDKQKGKTWGFNQTGTTKWCKSRLRSFLVEHVEHQKKLKIHIELGYFYL